jgi:hypothetical protein
MSGVSIRNEFQINCHHLNLCFRKYKPKNMRVVNFCSAVRKFNSPRGWGALFFKLVTCPTEFAASSQPLTKTVAICVNGCFCHESCQIVRQQRKRTDLCGGVNEFEKKFVVVVLCSLLSVV